MEEKSTALIPVPGDDVEVRNMFEESKKLLAYAETRQITSIQDIKMATDDLAIISKFKKDMEEKRKEYVKPLQDQVKAINDNYKSWMEPILEADMITRAKILAFNKEQERIRQEQEEINRKRMEAAEQEAKLKNGEISESVNLVEVIPPTPKTVSTGMGTTGMVENWKFEIVDFAQLPDEYKVPDTAMLTRTAKKYHDQKPVPGVRFYNEPTLRVNTK